MGRNTLSIRDVGQGELDGVSLKETEYYSQCDSMTKMVLEAISEFCRYTHVDDRQVEKKLKRYILYKDYTGFSNFFVRYAKDAYSLEMVEVYNGLSQEETEKLFVSLDNAFKTVPRELIYG